MENNGKIALITGAAGGLGRGIARSLANIGYALILQDKDAESLDAACAELSEFRDRVSSICCSVSDEAELQRGIFGKGNVDVLVNNAGITGRGLTIEEIDRNTLEDMLNVHIHGSYTATRCVLAGMKERKYGRIVNISSTRGQVGHDRGSHYCGAKAAILGMTKAWAKELAPWGILVNAIAPGPVRTPMSLSYGEESLRQEAELTLVKRIAEPQEIGGVVAFLVEGSGSFITGQTICVNGGDTIVGV
jgi:3-oxoacyl-[acyl-carrier protein] reductase